MITIFANFRINDEERFQNLQKSFFSFYKSNINNWIINIRGNKKDEVCKFLEKNILQTMKDLSNYLKLIKNDKNYNKFEMMNHIK